MKNKSFRLASLGLAVATLILVAACSDGVTPKTPEPSPSPSCNVTLQAYKIGQDVSSAVTGEIAITEGEGIVLVWTAGPVTRAVITSDPEAFLGAPMELTLTEKPAAEETAAKAESKGSGLKEAVGQKEFTGIIHNVSFTLAGTNEVKGNAPVECKGHMNVAVTPAGAEIKINKFTATPEIIAAGGTARLEWDVLPADATVTIVDDEGNALMPVVAEPEPVPEETSGEIVAKGSAKAVAEDEPEPIPCVTGEEEGCVLPPPVNSFPASGYIDVTPLKTTTYTLTATTADGQTLSANATVSIEEEGLEISFTANGVEGVYTLDKPGEVRLAWAVTPPEAVVTIDQGIGDVASQDVVTVNVSQTTTYTLTATLGDKVESKQVTVNLGQVVLSNLIATLKSNATSVFEGETVAISWSVADDAGTQLAIDTAKVTLETPQGRIELTGTGTSATFTPLLSGAYSVEVATDQGIVKSNSLMISVRTWVSNKPEVSVDGIEFVSGGNVVLFGSRKGGAKVGRLSSGGLWEDVAIDTAGIFTTLYNAKYNVEKFANMGPISFRAFAQDPEKGMIYGGGTGFIAYSSDNGSSWTGIDVFVVTKKGRTTFPTCFGETQKSKANDDDTLQNLHQFCDLLVDKNGGDRVIAATDFGVFYIDDIGARIGGGKNDWVKASGLEDVVVNNLVSFGGTTFAGTASGVWASADRGSTWSDFNGGAISSGQAIYALAIDASNKEIYAGGPDGVYYSKLGGSAEWVKLGAVEGAVYSIVVDPSQSGTVFVGSETGAYVSRDFGNTFSNISGAIGGAPVYDVAVNALTSSVGVYAASANGVFSSVAQVVPMITVETPPVVEEVPPVEPAAVNAVNALQALVK